MGVFTYKANKQNRHGSLTCNQKVEKFIELCGKEFECDDAMKDILQKCLKGSGLTTPVVVAAPTAAPVKATRPTTGYQLFFSTRNKELTPTMPEYKDCQKQISAGVEGSETIQNLSGTPRLPFQLSVAATKTHRPRSGYQLYFKEQSAGMKAEVSQRPRKE